MGQRRRPVETRDPEARIADRSAPAPTARLRPLGDQIVLHRQLHDLSQAALAKRLGVRQQTISRWESSGAVPPPARVIDLEDLFGLDRGALLRTAGYVDEAVGEPEVTLTRILSSLNGLSDEDLVLLIDTAWRIHRDRTVRARSGRRTAANTPRSRRPQS